MIVLVNKMTIKGSPEEYERLYARAGAFMETQEGLISYQLVRSQTDPRTYFNVAVWRDASDFERAGRDERFHAMFAEMVDLVEPDQHICQVVHEGAPGRAA
ncbi:Quinol monooxygenase YgiN [Streptoalloteichus tenebrarius]|uniref:Quinol monooxygenase YgiN n=1 Tax=Streptoalloteichus tenebrarius (strain ATCC 17920 / DSM 40477 / JCM 4838 / CBS 697.72 / NBRC 16177 / NCIMB 11028 / NRRL B-12390 / A12253. 1 / ISP 5477) TaxID=1933 RepID=A0ABT1I465_STRSD|nr:antibiotic biosynthesis monooxygenase family protein [Streptoalloteichus tenebrarius]MCP2262593.1 Quinol monooxygenase YgiN [Streptoalloteichus tenebrarius]BFF02988.1 hypothetical protein GCM10020241_46630 [Streptoalloteichus tenebrarius]